MSKLNFLVDYNPISIAMNKIIGSFNLLSDLFSHFGSLFFSKAPASVEKFFMFSGVSALTFLALQKIYKTAVFWKWVPQHNANKKKLLENRLVQKYGDCFAVVTGCTDGIGLQFTKQLVQMGFGIVLVARNEYKLNKRIRQIQQLYSQFRYFKIIGDLTKRQDNERIVKQLSALAEQIDIGIIVNNAGMSNSVSPYLKVDQQTILNSFEINFYAPYLINKALLPLLRKRKQRSAIINFSSITGAYISHLVGAYPASKQLFDIYSRTTSQENNQKVDIISVRPGGVMTSMTHMHKGKFMITPKQCVLSTLADLGNTNTTFTGFMHKVQASYFQSLTEQARLKVYDTIWRNMDPNK